MSDGGENKLVLGASWATKSKPAEVQDALQVRKSHLDLFALAPRLLEALSADERTGDVASMLMDIARDLTRRALLGIRSIEPLLVVGGSGSNGQAVELICARFIGIS